MKRRLKNTVLARGSCRACSTIAAPPPTDRFAGSVVFEIVSVGEAGDSSTVAERLPSVRGVMSGVRLSTASSFAKSSGESRLKYV